MIINQDIIENKYKCGHGIMEYLVYQCHLPILSIESDFFYFAKTKSLQKALKKMPLYLKILQEKQN